MQKGADGLTLSFIDFRCLLKKRFLFFNMFKSVFLLFPKPLKASLLGEKNIKKLGMGHSAPSAGDFMHENKLFSL